MGQSQSSRKITLVSDESAGVIQLSTSLAHRLRGQLEAEQSSSEKPSEAPPPYSSTSAKSSSTQPLQDTYSQQQQFEEDLPKITDSPNFTQVPPWLSYGDESHLLDAKFKEQKEAELRLKDEEWRQKLKEREKEYINMAKLSSENFESALREVEKLFRTVSLSSVCQENQDRVLKCYQENSSKPLNCAQEVGEFARCVDLSRLETLMQGRQL